MPINKDKNETYQDWRDRVIDKISPSFCGAKWYNATVWLNSGTTASCHHPPAHKIPLEEVMNNPKAIHNTKYKKMVRKQMLDGERPKECDYCWKVEDLGKEYVSDRTYKSVIYDNKALEEAATKYDYTKDVPLKTLEIAFDANCNLACSYCNASFSTQWQNDIKKNGAYQNLVSDGARAFQQDGSWAMPYGKRNEGNPYVDAFFKWWDMELKDTLEELRVTGGEATMSPDFWRLIEWWKQNPDCNVRFSVNSNLGAKPQLMKKLVEATHSFKQFDLYTSNEAFGNHAEYIRDGLQWETWLNNIHMFLREGNIREFHMMMTIPALALFSMPEFMDEMLKLKQQYGKYKPTMSFNLLRFPSFQSIVTLPDDVRNERADALEKWLEENKNAELLHEMEIDGIKRTIEYTRSVRVGHNYTSSEQTRHRDFKTFYSDYDRRRGKSFLETFKHQGLTNWFTQIPDTKLEPLKGLFDGDSTKGALHKQELEKRAKAEGWVLDAQGPNPGSQEYVEKV